MVTANRIWLLPNRYLNHSLDPPRDTRLGGFSGSTNISVGDAPISVAIGVFNADG